MQPTVDERTAECARWATVPLPVSHSGCAVRYLLALLRRVDACARAAALRCTVSVRHSLTHSALARRRVKASVNRCSASLWPKQTAPNSARAAAAPRKANYE